MQSIFLPLRAVLCAALIVLSPGCTFLTELHDAVKNFYRVQGTGILAGYHEIAGLLIRMKEDPESAINTEVSGQLSAVEEMLDTTCWPLQRISFLRSMGEEVDGGLSDEAYRSYDLCEDATLDAKNALNRIARKLAAKHRRP